MFKSSEALGQTHLSSNGGLSEVGMERDLGSFPTYTSFEAIPSYIPPQPTPLPSHIDEMNSPFDPNPIIDHPQPTEPATFGLQVFFHPDSRI